MCVRTYQEMSCYCTYKSDALCLLHSTVDQPCLLNVHSCIRMYVRMCTCQDCMYILPHVCIMLAWVLCIHTYVQTALHTDTYHVRRCHAEKFRHHTRNRQVEDPTELAHQVPCLEQQLQGQRVGWLRGAYILYMCHGVCPNVCTYVRMYTLPVVVLSCKGV